MPLTVGDWPSAAVVAEAGASTPSPFRVWSAATIVAEAMAAVPLIVVPMAVPVIVPVLKLTMPMITTPEPVVLVYAPFFAATVASHKGAVHREAVHHVSAMAAPSAAAMGATTTATAARQRSRVAEQDSGEADGGDDHQYSCRHWSANSGRRERQNGKYKFRRHYHCPGA